MQPLSKIEKALTGSKSLSLQFLPRYTGRTSSGQSTPRRNFNQNTPTGSLKSIKSNQMDEIIGMYIHQFYAAEQH